MTSALLSSCSSGSSDGTAAASASASSSSSASSSASGSATPTPTVSPAAAPRPAGPPPKAPRARAGGAGEKAFTRYVVSLWSYALRTDDARPLTSLSPKKKPCAGCAAFAAEMGKRHRQHWSTDFPGARVRAITVTEQGPTQTYGRATIDIPKSMSYNADGSYRNTNQAHPRTQFEVLMNLKNKRYQLLAFTVTVR